MVHFTSFDSTVICDHISYIIHISILPSWYLAFPLLLSSLSAPSLPSLPGCPGYSNCIQLWEPLWIFSLTMLQWFRPTFAITHGSSSPKCFTDILSSIKPILNKLVSCSPHPNIYKLLPLFSFYLTTNSTIYNRHPNWLLGRHSRFLFHPQFPTTKESQNPPIPLYWYLLSVPSSFPPIYHTGGTP